jgi:ATP diphosphatase
MYQMDDLLYLMSRLRHPEHGCPWDLKQSYESIVPHTLEEAYEVADAISRGDRNDIKDELGDLLFQVIFYAQLGKEEQSFEFDDVVDSIVQKLVRRHPHVFPEGQLRKYFPEGTNFSDDQIKSQWETIKQEERQLKKQQSAHPTEAQTNTFQPEIDSVLSDVPSNLPVLNRAEKLQKRAAQHGFDWPNIKPVIEKLEEELAELKVEIAQAEKTSFDDEQVHKRLQDEMGDVLFCCVNLSRFLKVKPEQALRSTNDKFVRRFQFIEAQLLASGLTLESASLEELDRVWDQAKVKGL